MKKIILLFLALPLVLLLSACNSEIDSEKAAQQFVDFTNNVEQYTLEGQLHIAKQGDEVTFNVKVDYLTPSNYKVTLDNTQNNNRQIIIKNNDGVFVLTPALNRVFRFDSQWPSNSSHVYLLSSLAMDIANDDNSEAKLENDNVVIKSTVDYKTNVNLTHQKITICPEKFTLKRVAVYDSQEEIQIRFEVTSFKTDTNLRSSDFHVEETMRSNQSLLGPGSTGTLEGSLTVNYFPEGTETTVSQATEDTTIKTFSGDIDVVIVSTRIEPTSVSVPVKISDDLAIFSKGIAVFNEHSMEFYHFDKHITIFSSTLQPHEFIGIASSLTWQ